MQSSDRLPDGPVRLLIHGRVQGVGFRETMVFEANRRGVRGWVRNRRDGTVEAVLDGPRDVRATLFAWANSGPSGALVTRIEARAANAAEAAAVGAQFVRLPTSA